MSALKQMTAGLGRELELAQRELDDSLSGLMAHAEGEMLRRLADALRRSERRQSVIRQLISLGKDEPDAAEPVDLNETIRSDEPRLLRILGPQNSLALELEASLPLIAVSSAEMREHIRTLIQNAHDAMPDGGAVTVFHPLVQRARQTSPGAAVRPGHRQADSRG